MTTIEHLTKARELVSKGWCKGVYAQDANGRQVPYGGDAGVRFCMSGALHVVMLGNPNVQLVRTVKAIMAVIGWPIAPWNDQPERTHEEVLKAFDDTIAAEQKKLDYVAGIL